MSIQFDLNVTAEQLSSSSGAVALGELRLCGSEQSGRKSLYHAVTDSGERVAMSTAR
jgi:hypothetical protein